MRESSALNGNSGYEGPRKIETRWLCAPAGVSDHSNATNAVNLPGRLNWFATRITSLHVVRRRVSEFSSGSGAAPRNTAPISLSNPGRLPVVSDSYQLVPSKSGCWSSIARVTPMYSAWSDTARKSSGARRFTSRPK